MVMDPFRHVTEHHIHIQDLQRQEKKITKEQERILFQVHLANVLLFGAGRLNSEQQISQNQLKEEYFRTLKQGDEVDIGLTGMMGGDKGTIIANDGKIIKVQAGCYCNKIKKIGIRSFSAIDGYSKGPLLSKDLGGDTDISRFYLEIPESFTVKSTAGIPQEALDEINEIYKQAGDEKTCYDLVNALKYGTPKDDIHNLPF